MNYNELLEAAELVEASGPCETIGHWSFAKALKAIIELHSPGHSGLCDWCTCRDCDHMVSYPCKTIQTIERELQ